MNPKTILVYLFFLLSAGKGFCYSQSDTLLEHRKIPDDNKPRVIVDPKSKIKIILDSSHIFMEARSESNVLLWRTDPWKDAKLKVYRVNRPHIVTFLLANDKSTHYKDVIELYYNSSQSGYLDMQTGKFTYVGRD